MSVQPFPRRDRETIVFSAVCLIVALALAMYVASGGADNTLDHCLFSSIQALRTPSLDVVMLLATYLCSWPVIATSSLLAAGFFLLNHRWPYALLIAVSLACNLLVNSTIKDLVHRIRPDQTIALLPAAGTSFPSGHTFSAFAFYGVVAVFAVVLTNRSALRRAIVVATVLFIALVGLSRVYLGAHWPTDVIESCLLGLTLLACLWTIVERLPSAAQGKSAVRGGYPVVVIWLIFVVGFAMVHPITESVGALGETIATPLATLATKPH